MNDGWRREEENKNRKKNYWHFATTNPIAIIIIVSPSSLSLSLTIHTKRAIWVGHHRNRVTSFSLVFFCSASGPGCVCVCGFQCLPICRMWISQMPEIVPIWKIMLFLCASAHGPNVDKSGCVCDTFYFQFQTLMRTTFQQLPSCYSPTPTRRMTNTDSWNSVRRCAERIHPRWPTLLPTHSIRHNRQSTVALHDYWLHFQTKFPVDFEHTRSNWPYCTKFIIAATVTATSKSSSTTTKMQSFRSTRKSQNRHGNS